MKNLKNTGLLLLGVITMASCSKDEETPLQELPPSATEFNSIREAALLHQTQSFTATQSFTTR